MRVTASLKAWRPFWSRVMPYLSLRTVAILGTRFTESHDVGVT